MRHVRPFRSWFWTEREEMKLSWRNSLPIAPHFPAPPPPDPRITVALGDGAAVSGCYWLRTRVSQLNEAAAAIFEWQDSLSF